MALKIRLRQQGRKNHRTFRLVVMDARNPRDGKYVESLGWYDPALPNEKNAEINSDRVEYWLGVGAQLTENAKVFVGNKSPEVLKKMHAKRVEAKKKK